MSGDYDSVQEIGGTELARHYPDRGPIHDSHWYNAILHIEPRVDSSLAWLQSISIASNGFIAVLSASSTGLRVRVSLYDFAIFIPWPEAIVSAERGWPATVVRLKTAAVPSLILVFHLDDAAADDLLQGIIPPLLQRDPPQRLGWALAQSLEACVVLVVGLCSGLLIWLVLK